MSNNKEVSSMSSIGEILLGIQFGPLSDNKTFRAPVLALETVKNLLKELMPGDEIEISDYMVARWAIELLSLIEIKDLKELLALNVQNTLGERGVNGLNGDIPHTISTEQARVLLGFNSQETVRKWIKKEKLKVYPHPGRNYKILKSSVDKWLKGSDPNGKPKVSKVD